MAERGSEASHVLDPVRAVEFRAYLERLLSLPGFAARRRGQLLRYLLERKLAGQSADVTEYGIALDVFEKPASFDPRLEATVRVEMSRLRRALLDYYAETGAEDPWRIELPARGYVPVIQPNGSPIEPAAPQQAAPAERPFRKSVAVVMATVIAIATIGAIVIRRYWPVRQPSTRSVAVLPFANLTGNAGNDYLADGVTEQLTDALAQVPSLRVVARTSAFQFKGKAADIREIGRRLDADTVVEGSLHYLGAKLRLTVQINRSSDGYHIFSRTLEGSMQDLALLENDVAPLLVAAIRPGSAMPKRRTPDPEAYDLYLKAQAYRGQGTREAFDRALTYLNQAIERDPKFADAYAALGSVYAAGAVNLASEPVEYALKAKAAAARAIELDPACSRAYSVEGYVDSLVMLDWKKGDRELREAIELMPQNATNHNWLGSALLARGRFDEAIREQRITESLDPLSPGVGTGLAYYMARRYDDALRQFLKVRDLHPDLILVHALIGSVWQEKHEFDKAMAEYQLVLPKIPSEVKSRITLLLATTGKRPEARKMLADLEDPKPTEPPTSDFDLAVIYTALGDRDSAFQHLNQAYKRRNVWFVKVYPALDPIRDDPRYAEFLRRIGLAD